MKVFDDFCGVNKNLTRFAFFLFAWFSSGVFAQYQLDPYALFTVKRPTGIRFGKWVLHGAFSGSVLYDTNVLFEDLTPVQDFAFELVPGLDAVFEGARLNMLVGYRFKRVDFLEQNNQDYNAHSAYLKSSYVFSRKFLVRVDEFFERTSDPADRDIPERVGRLSNKASIELVHRTPADDLETGLKYSNHYQKFDTTFSGLNFFNNKVLLTSKVNLSSKFRFLPKSVLLINAEYGMTDFTNNSGPPPQNTDSQGWALNTGLSSQFTRKLNMSGQVGFSALYFDSNATVHSFVGLFNVAYQLGPRINFLAGYQRKLEASTFTDYMRTHEFSLEGHAILTHKMKLDVKNRLGLIEFSGPNVIPTGETRDDFLYQMDTILNYEVRSWLKPRVTYSFIYRDSNSTSFFLNSQSADFLKHQVGLGVDLYY